MPLRGQTVLITGASSGIGAATALALAGKGARLLLTARREDRLKAVAEDVRAAGGRASVYPADLADAPAVARMAAAIRADAGIPDVLINNAGAGRWLPLLETSPDDARRMIEVPYLAAVYVTREFLGDMVKRGSGHLVNVTSPASFLAWPNACGYIAARHALRGFTEALRAELRGTGLHVTLVVLGKVASSYWTHNPGSEEKIPKVVSLLARDLTTDEAASAIVEGLERRRRQIVKPAIYRLLMSRYVPAWVTGTMAGWPG
jgi:short-subunit dehydrogenase